MARAKVRYRTRLVRARTRRMNKTTLPIAAIGGFLPMTVDAINGFYTGGFTDFSRSLVAKTTGYDFGSQAWKWEHIRTGLFPIIMGLIVHKYIGGRLGINRTLASAGVPLLRL